MSIPVFHDDQHGTAINCLGRSGGQRSRSTLYSAGIINVLKMKKMNIQDAKIVMVGAGAAGIACMNMVKVYGADPNKVGHLGSNSRSRARSFSVFYD